MSKRFLSLYYGSISGARSVQALGCWAAGLLARPTARREVLSQAVQAHFGDIAVFSLSSGRSALAACLRAAGIGPGDEVLLSAYTCLAVPTAVIAAGAKPVYIDINPTTLNVDAEAVLAALSSRVRAVVVQHTLGKVAPIQAIIEGARKRGVLVIEDCALSLGSSIDGRYAGTFGDAAIFSMELSKTLSCGWGGVLLVNNPTLAKAVTGFYATLPEPGWWSSTRDLWQTVISAWCYRPAVLNALGKYVLFAGFKIGYFRRSTPAAEFEGCISPQFLSTMGAAQAGLAILQWRDFSQIAAACAGNARELRNALQQLNIEVPGAPREGEVSVTPRVSFLVTDRGEAVSYFRANGIELGQWFDGPLSPIPRSPLFNYRLGSYLAAENVAKRVVNLPCHSRLAAADLAHMITTLKHFVRDCPENVVRATREGGDGPERALPYLATPSIQSK